MAKQSSKYFIELRWNLDGRSMEFVIPLNLRR